MTQFTFDSSKPLKQRLPQALVAMSVVFSVLGMADQRLQPLHIAALGALHLICVKMLSDTLSDILREWTTGSRPKAASLTLLGLSFAVLDVWLVHFGLELVLIKWSTGQVIAASVAFAAVNILSEWSYTPTEKKDAPTSLGENIREIGSKIAGKP